MQWTRQLRYKPYQAWPTEYLEKIEKQATASTYYPQFHIAPNSGLLNDPNGFSYFNGKWHVFYQAFPFGPVHGLKSWVHLISADLVNWKKLGPALLPDSKYDAQGVYSGSAHQIGDQLFLMYTGNVRDQNWQRHPYQNGAWLDQNNKVTKLSLPLISQPEQTTDHFRDPQLIEKDGKYYVLIGAQDKKSLAGRINVFTSDNLTAWKNLGYLNFSADDLGYMIECPNLVTVDQQPVLIFCPQGLEHEILPYQNIYPNTYLIGSQVDLDSASFTSQSNLALLDYGFDIYASQAFNAPDGQAYLISWLGLPEIEYPTDAENWAHCLSLVKRLTIKNHRLYQQPVANLKKLRQQEHQLTGQASGQVEKTLAAKTTNQYELKLEIPADQQGTLWLFRDSEKAEGLKIKFATGKVAKILIDRSQTGQPFAKDYGQTRQVALNANQPLHLDIFVDHSVCEVFVNQGEAVFSLRVFPSASANKISLAGKQQINYNGSWWNLAKSCF
ncbi:sucrose-6-phosphate hydrolase [Liquorilactobacillus sicerae]|uniref:sucrose-6-phosphate hydrolase n=1 Tax=Liquorilactobacillus sicerae TaxID=1416943 RepID=UPI00248015A8|nr:sucrose-6-phosphate hydrolase [Liquorilactobacillus sicerae]